jgi:Stress responsive A/B Barrel Domain
VILHLVCFKYKPTTDDAARADHRARLSTLQSLDGVVDLRVGADVVRSPRSYDTGLAITFRDRAALEAYAIDPRHVPIAQLGVAACEHIVAVDFEI